MDSIGDYIYLIIIVIAALSGFFKKKKPQTVTETTQPFEEEEEIEEMEEMNKPFFPKEIFEEKNKNYEVNYQPLSFDTATDFSKLKAQKQVTITSKFNKNIPLLTAPEEESESEYHFESMDDVKKAIIFTEIFNRKY